MTYEPNSYWRAVGKREPGIMDPRHPKGRGKTKRNIEAQELLLPAVIQSLNPQSVFEVGCGWGRMTRLISDIQSIKQYDAIDLSAERLQNAKLNAKMDVHFYEGDFMEYDPAPYVYDVVFACEVLMHIPPATIKDFMAKMGSMSKGYVVNLDYWEASPIPLEPHNFNHPYMDIYGTLGAKRVTQTQLRTQSHWWGGERFPQRIFVATVKA